MTEKALRGMSRRMTSRFAGSTISMDIGRVGGRLTKAKGCVDDVSKGREPAVRHTREECIDAGEPELHNK